MEVPEGDGPVAKVNGEAIPREVFNRKYRRQLDRYFRAKQSSAGARPYQLLGKLLRKELSDEQQAAGRLRELLDELYHEDADNAALGYYLAAQLMAAKAQGRVRRLIMKKTMVRSNSRPPR